ncbi:MAG: fumarylacetoacetate hydrolase family protein [Desulfobulbaceae bacterium]|nr:fumarylacetoacetate hydrolase family protein [Desulfobulbaceae bacterium]
MVVTLPMIDGREVTVAPSKIVALGLNYLEHIKESQSVNVQNFINIPQIISFISRNFTLEPGDIIITGTLSGVGPLQHGDVVEVEIENIGILKNPVVAE